MAATSENNIDEEIHREEEAMEVGRPFVKNGSRDRWGNLRRSVGGRPKKRVLEDHTEAPAGLKEDGKGNRKRAGCRSRTEFSAHEKITMCKKVRLIQAEVEEKYADRKAKVVEAMKVKAVRKAFPNFKRGSAITRFLELEEFCQQVVVKNALGTDLQNPGRRSRGAMNASRRTSSGQHPSVGCRRSGGGRNTTS